MIDTKPIDEKRYLRAGFEMTKANFADPASGLQYGGQGLLTHPKSVVGCDKVEDIQPSSRRDGIKAEKRQSCRIEILGLPFHAGESDEVGGTFDQRDETPRFHLHTPAPQRDGRIVCTDSEKQTLRIGRKIMLARPANHYRVAAEPDR